MDTMLHHHFTHAIVRLFIYLFIYSTSPSIAFLPRSWARCCSTSEFIYLFIYSIAHPFVHGHDAASPPHPCNYLFIYLFIPANHMMLSVLLAWPCAGDGRINLFIYFHAVFQPRALPFTRRVGMCSSLSNSFILFICNR